MAPANGAGSGERLEKSTCKTLQRGLQGEFAGQEYSNGGGAKIFARAPPEVVEEIRTGRTPGALRFRPDLSPPSQTGCQGAIAVYYKTRRSVQTLWG